MTAPNKSDREAWPALALAEWKDTCRTLHRWTQMAGKVQLALTPRTNHWWNVALHTTARGFATGPIPHARGPFTMEFDLVDHLLRIDLARGERRDLPLAPQSDPAGVPRRLHRQVQPGALLLGKLRPVRDALLGPPRAAAARRRRHHA